MFLKAEYIHFESEHLAAISQNSVLYPAKGDRRRMKKENFKSRISNGEYDRIGKLV